MFQRASSGYSARSRKVVMCTYDQISDYRYSDMVRAYSRDNKESVKADIDDAKEPEPNDNGTDNSREND